MRPLSHFLYCVHTALSLTGFTPSHSCTVAEGALLVYCMMIEPLTIKSTLRLRRTEHGGNLYGSKLLRCALCNVDPA